VDWAGEVVDQDGRNGQDGGAKVPPDAQQMRLGRSRAAHGYADRSQESGLIGGAPATADDASVPTGEGPDTLDLSPRFRPWSEPAQSSAVPLRCHFLRMVTPDGKLAEAQATAIPSHRCAAFGDPLPLSLRQQELVCLQRVHVSCPRYVRGTLLASEAEARPEGEGTRRRFPLMTIVAIALVGISILALIAGGLGFFGGGTAPASSPTPSTVAGASTTPSGSAESSLTAGPSATPTATPRVTPSATPTATPSPSPTPTKSASATPVPPPTWPPGATASRMDLLTPCTDQPNCWLYTVRSGEENGSPGHTDDTVPAIATFFGVRQSDILSLNPWAAGGITPGQQLKIPNPTR
jgi:hypothetical protein